MTDNAVSSCNYRIYNENGHINYQSPICLLASVIVWRCLYHICRFALYRKGPEYSSRIISLLHAILTSFLGINQCFLFDWPFDHPEWKTNDMQSFIMTASFGYFVHDFIWMLKYDRKDRVMLCHHAVCIWALYRMLFKGYSGAQTTCSLGSMEITNPFLQARWFLRSEGMYRTPLYYSTEFTFVLVFVIVRIIIGTFFFIRILRQPKNDWDFVLATAGVYILSWKFVWEIFKYVFQKYIDPQQPVVENNAQKDDSKTD